jgi:hypothetical protein
MFSNLKEGSADYIKIFTRFTPGSSQSVSIRSPSHAKSISLTKDFVCAVFIPKHVFFRTRNRINLQNNFYEKLAILKNRASIRERD